MVKSYNQIVIEKIVEPFRKEHGDGEFTHSEMAAWAIQQGLWKPTMKSQIAILRGEISEAMQAARTEYKGLKVRQYHCVDRQLDDGSTQIVWAHIDVATPAFMEQSFARRRRALAVKAYQLHSDIVYWNDEKNPGCPVEMLFDFRDDIADREHQRTSTAEAEVFQHTD
jgi:hypothetical protein